VSATDLRGALLALASALPAGSAISVPREALLDLLNHGSAPDQEPPDRLLNAEQVATRMHVSEAWVYRQARRWPFTRKLGRRAVRFSEAGLVRWLSSRNAS